MSGFDLLEDEAVVDHHLLSVTDVLPADWVLPDNPGFAYYSYYVYANLVSLNHLRRYIISFAANSVVPQPRLKYGYFDKGL